FPFGKSIGFLLISRVIQGVGSSCSSVAGMLADRYSQDEQRGIAMGIALSGLALGEQIGPLFGKFTYEYVRKESGFLVLAALSLFGGLLQLTVLKPGVSSEQIQGTSLKVLIRDPYILLAAGKQIYIYIYVYRSHCMKSIGAIAFGNIGSVMMEPSLPQWMLSTMGATESQQRFILLPTSFWYLISAIVFGIIAHKMGRWLCCMIGLLLIFIALICVPLTTSIVGLIIPNSLLGVAIGMVNSSMMPTMGYLVDRRHVSVYGNVYAIADVVLCLGYVISPVLSGFCVRVFGFRTMLHIISFICLCYAPLMLFLRNPPTREETIPSIMNENPNSFSYIRS
ncbi:unnamed protein product, partial [Rotaria sp. Silwood1]